MKISLWIIIGLIISAICVSTLGAYFSVIGLGALFSGAVLAVWMMAGALELSKFVLAAYIHQRWQEIHGALKYYLTFAIVILSCITSLGIFGFLSDAYQSASTAIQTQQVQLDAERNKQVMYKNEIERLTTAIDEVPDDRINKKMKLRAKMEPMISDLTKKLQDSEKSIADFNLQILDVHKKVGPLIYISKAFGVDIDIVVKYLIFIFVSVFDPLAICLVIASSQALYSRSAEAYAKRATAEAQSLAERPYTTTPIHTPVEAPLVATPQPPAPAAASVEEQPTSPAPEAASMVADPFADAEIIEMSFEDPALTPAQTDETKKTS